MKYLKMAEGASGLFGKKVTVILESQGGEILGHFKLEEDQVPESFNRPVTIEVEGILWRVIAVSVIREKSILRSRKLVIKVIKKDEFENGQRTLIPTIAFPNPELTETIATGDPLALSLEEWRQMEFLPSLLLQTILDELKEIENILSPEISPDPLQGYSGFHVRKLIGNTRLAIPMSEICMILGVEISGVVLINGMVVKDSFVLRTQSKVYYGIVEDSKVNELSIFNFDFVDDEFMAVSSTFNLVLADWCNAAYTFIDLQATEGPPASDTGDIMGIT